MLNQNWLKKPKNEREFKILASDKMWRLHNLYYIVNEQGQKLLFRPRTAQLQFLIERHGFDIILKARQLGFSTIIQLDMLDDCLFNGNKNAGIIAQSMKDAEEIFATKLKFPYDNFPGFLKEFIYPIRDSRTEIEFNNGSKIRVGVSMRSSTLTNLHVSEHGKICAKDPARAKEIKTGSLNTVHIGQKITIESTAEGREGDFFELCKKAQGLNKHSALDFKFHFYPWYQNPGYVMDEDVVIPAELDEYFDKLEVELDVQISRQQRNWYTKKEALLTDSMKQEFPSTPKEAFEQAIDGAYFSRQMSDARKERRIGFVPHNPSIPVNTFWDIGINDACAIWLHQRDERQDNFIGYYENSGENFPHYVKWLQETGYNFRGHYLPHDANNKSFRVAGSTMDDAYKLLTGEVYLVPRVKSKLDAINAVRARFHTVFISEQNCAQGIAHLDNYKKEWNDHLGVWRNTPRHDAASHGADAFQTWATGYDARVESEYYAEDDQYYDESEEVDHDSVTGY